MKKFPKLNEKQLFALDCIAKGRVTVKRVHNTFVRSWAGGILVLEFFAIDSNITNQIKSLRGRGLVVIRDGHVKLTQEGQLALDKVQT
jgi:predicted lipase